jgi:thiol reductant ABC exporter CydD subunit
MRNLVARRLLRDLDAGRRSLGMAAVVGVATAATIVVQAALLGDILARTFLKGASLGDLAGPLAWLAVTYAVRAVLLSAFELSGQLGALRVMADLRARLVRHLLVVAPGSAPERHSGALATAAVQGVDALGIWFSRYLPQVVLSALVPPAILGYLLTRDVTAAAVLAATVPVLILFMVLIGLGAQAHARSRWRALSGLGAHFADVVRGLPTLRAHVREGAQAERIGAVAERYRVETMRTLRVAFLSAFVLELCAMIGTALVAATVGLQLVGGHVSLSAGLTVLILCPELYAPLRAVGQQFHASTDGLAAAERLLAVLDEPAAVVTAPDAAATAPDPAVSPVVLRDVVHGYGGEGPDVLRGASLTIAPGETVALVGPSGAGKTTLTRLLLRLADPDAGTVSCGATDLRDVDVDAWRARIAWVPQRPALLAASIAENIAVARPGAGRAEIREAARRAGVLGFADRLTDGLDTRVGDGGRALSGGEAQRVALARAFLRDAPLVILDEPTAHLDAETADDVSREIAALCAGRSALLVVHRPELAALADRVVALDDGRVTECAAPAPLAVAA